MTLKGGILIDKGVVLSAVATCIDTDVPAFITANLLNAHTRAQRLR